MNKEAEIKKALDGFHAAMVGIGCSHVAILVAFELDDLEQMGIMRSEQSHDSDIAYLVRKAGNMLDDVESEPIDL